MGRPPRYDDPIKMEKAIEEYFDSLTDDSGEFDKVPTMAGLTRAIGFMDRSALDEYQKREGFSHIVKDAKNRIQEYWERRLAGNACTGAIFWLKNHAGYRDSHEVTGRDGGPIGFRFVDAKPPNTEQV